MTHKRYHTPHQDIRTSCDVCAADQGAGLFAVALGFTIFMLLLIASVQILFNLHANTMVTDAAFNATRIVASYSSVDNRCASTRKAEQDMRHKLRSYLQKGSLTLSWVCDDIDAVTLRIVARHPNILPSSLRNLTSLGRLEKVITTRLESRQ